MSFVWTDQNIETMTRLAHEKISAREAAARLGTTRNAVLGKAFRLGVSFNNKPAKVAKRPRPEKHFIWNEKAIARLREMSEENLTSQEMASRLIREFCRPIGPSGVRTKAASLGIQVGGGAGAQVNLWRTKGLHDEKRLPNMRAVFDGYTPPAVGDIPIRGVAFMDLKLRSCRYPLGDPKDADYGYCGSDAKPGSAYCAGHHQLCYRPDKKAARSAAACREG
jgi:GcrA cell cycle regulator